MSTSGASTELAISRGADVRRAYQGSDAGGEPGQAALADGLGTRLGPAATFATTEHFNLQTARAITVSEANGRASIYLAALSGNLIALAFVGQMSRLGATFYAFALILLPVLGVRGGGDIRASGPVLDRGPRLRASDRAPAQLLPAFLAGARAVPRCCQAGGAGAHGDRLAPSAWQLTLTAAGMVAVVNSVVVAACAGLVLEAAGVRSLAIPVAVGAVIGAGAFTLQERHHRRARDSYSPGDVDRAAILISPPQPAAAA